MKGPKYFIDTNIFLRLLIRDEPAQFLECEKLIQKIRKKDIHAFTSSLVLAEVVWTCLRFYKLAKPEVLEIANSLQSIKNLKFEDKSNTRLAVELFAEHNVKFIDCLIASHPQIAEGKAAVVSYDRDFDALSCKRLSPGQV